MSISLLRDLRMSPPVLLAYHDVDWMLRLIVCSAEFPDDKVHSLSTNEHLNVENDGKVTTQ